MDQNPEIRIDANPRPKIFHGWYIVACGFLSQGMRVGLGAQTFGFFFKPMIEELGWSRSVMTGALLARDLVRAGASPAFGYAVDRYGPRFLMAGSAVVLGISLMLLSQTHEIWHFVLFYGVIGTFGIPGLSYSVISPTIAKWFIRHRGKATGIATAGLNLGAVALTPLILFLIQEFGWRTAWFILGFVPWIVVVPPCLLWLRRQPEDMGLLPDGAKPAEIPVADDKKENIVEHQAAVDEVSWTVGQALRSPSFWLLVAYEVLSGMSIGALIIHRIPYATDLGLSDAQAGISFAIYGICAFAAKLVWGFLADRYSIWLLAIVALIASAVSILAGVGSTSAWQFYGTFGVMYGLTGGSLVVIGPLLWAAHFGRAHQGTIRGVMSPFYLIASIGGPMFAAVVFDYFGSYDAAWRVFAAYFLVSALLVWLAGRAKSVGAPVAA